MTLRSRDAQLVQIVDAAVAEASRRSGTWLHCAPGCTQCCVGVFAISQLDAARLRAGLAELETADPGRAAAVRRRAEDSAARLSAELPAGVRVDRFEEIPAELLEDFGNEEACPALDPATGLCDLYAARPITCRVFGLPLRVDGGLGVCELCFRGASPEEIAACELQTGADALEAELTEEAEKAGGQPGHTIVAWALIPGAHA